MKSRWYRRSGAKFFQILLVIAGMTAAGVCGICSLGLMAQYGIRPFDRKEYVQSQSFNNNLMNRSYEILEALRKHTVLEEGNGSDLIDLKELQQNEAITNTNTYGIAYKAEDLRQWSQEIWDNEVKVLICTKTDGSEYYIYYDDFAQLIHDGELQFVYGEEAAQDEVAASDVLNILYEEVYAYYETDDYSNDMGIRSLGIEGVEDSTGELAYINVWNYCATGNNDAAIQERYKPDGAGSILDILNENAIWNGNINEAYQLLNMALMKYEEAAQAVEILEIYEDGNSNLNYLYADKKSGKMYSNIVGADYKKILDKIKSDDDPYMVISSKLQDCETNLTDIEAQTIMDQQNLVKNAGIFDEDYIYAISVDHDFNVTDALADERVHYDKYAPWLMPMLSVAVLMLFLVLIVLFLLTCSAGRTNEDENVHLNFIDKIWTEIAAGMIGCIWVCGLEIPLELSTSLFSGRSLFDLAVVSGVCAGWTMIWFLAGWMSLVRRIKAKTLWKNSCCCFVLYWTGKLFFKCVRLITFLVEGMVSRTRLIIAFAVFSVIQILCGACAFGGSAPIFLFLMVAVDWAALYYLLKKAWGREQIMDGLKKITDGDLQYKIPLDKLDGEQKTIAEYINHIGEGLDAAVENSLKNERMKAELITNVSHDIKTPLTSIINYIDLLKREELQDPKIRGYLEVLESKAHRLQILTEDVVEASKASTGNITLEITELNLVEMLHQMIGEFEERFQEKNLTLILHFDQDEAMICADGRRLWRVLENLFGNVSKYAMENTRVYADLTVRDAAAVFSLKNISAQPLNISAEELTERFIRGDVSRNTEGSGLGLSIAKDLTELQGGKFHLYLDGDLFKVSIEFTMK